MAVAEHQLVGVDLAADGTPGFAGGLRWAGVQEVRLLRPATLHASLAGLGDAPTADGTGEPTGYLGVRLRAGLAAADGELAGLPDDVLLVEAGTAQYLRRPPTDLPVTGGTALAELSQPADFGPTDPADPGWHPLALPFLGRIQDATRDAPGADTPNPLQVDPVLVHLGDRAAGRPLTALAFELATRAADAPATVVLSAADLATVRATARLDPLTPEESWFRLHRPSAEPDDLAGVSAQPFPQETCRLTSIYSKGDGVIRWQAAVIPYGDCVEVTGSHTGLIVNREAYRAVATALANQSCHEARRTHALAGPARPGCQDVRERRAARSQMICNCFEPIAHPAQRLTLEPDAYVTRDPHGEATWAG